MKTFKHYASCLFAAAFLITGCQNSNSTSATAETTTEADSLAIGKDPHHYGASQHPQV